MNGTTKHKYVTIGFIYLFGLICASFMGKELSFIAAFVFLSAFLFKLLKNRTFPLQLMVLAAAFTVFGFYSLFIIEKSYELDGSTAYVRGTVTECRNPDNDTVMLSITGEAQGVPLKFTLFTADTGIGEGDSVEFTAMFSEFRDKSDFAEASYYYSKNIFLKAYAKSDIVTEKNADYGFITKLSDYLKDRLDAVFYDDAGGIIKAMIFGDKSGLSSKLSASIRRSGIAHLTAVSGLHLSLMVHTAAVIIQLISGGKKRIAGIFSVFFTAVLMVFFGMTASVIRSGLMMIFYYSSAFFFRKTATIKSLDMALLLILIFSPCACRDTGLWLSVLGTIGVGVVSPLICNKLKIKEENTIGTFFISSLSAALCTAPVGALCFGGISFAAAITSILVQPFFTFIIILVPLAFTLTFISEPLFYISGIAARIMCFIAEFIGGQQFSYTEVSDSLIVLLFIFIIIGAGIILLITERKVHLIYMTAAFIAAFIGAISSGRIADYENIRISVHSDGENALLKVEDKTGVSAFISSDSKKAIDLIYEHTIGDNLNLVCIIKDTDNNNEIENNDYKCTVHIPEYGDMIYNMSGYTVYIVNGEVILNIRGISVGMLPIKSETLCDAAVYTGYSKNFIAKGNSATILCDKKFYNCDGAVNACYNKAELIIRPDGGMALITD